MSCTEKTLLCRLVILNKLYRFFNNPECALQWFGYALLLLSLDLFLLFWGLSFGPEIEDQSKKYRTNNEGMAKENTGKPGGGSLITKAEKLWFFTPGHQSHEDAQRGEFFFVTLCALRSLVRDRRKDL